MTAIEIESIEALDFDHTIMCEANGKVQCHGENPATVIVTLACCKVQRFFCDSCLTRKMQFNLLLCTVCGEVAGPEYFYQDVRPL